MSAGALALVPKEYLEQLADDYHNRGDLTVEANLRRIAKEGAGIYTLKLEVEKSRKAYVEVLEKRVSDLEGHLRDRIEIAEGACKCSQADGPCVHKRRRS